ncbi:hypothetical protein A0H81_04399 [Grifola frondosa]|uniref:Anaphase-promoting complex subunit 5 n=1 Tax=Grifola frondosa TaxID=5627 RepID=A0A1C7MFX8_GRIFR|nr:hypothetical protein A0H81_04399 [Grifola frondosa]
MPPPFMLHIYRLVLSEVSEVSEPRSYKQLMLDISRAPMADMPITRDFIANLNKAPKVLQTPEQLTEFFQGIPVLFLDRDEDEIARFSRRSLFGYFCRRCFFFGTAGLPGYSQKDKDLLSNDYQIFKTRADKKQYATAEAYSAWEKSLAVGDITASAENLRRFFEQHFHLGNDSGLRQHALLNLARMHYLRQEPLACRKILQEAIGVARTCNDNKTLQHCLSMLHRLPPLEHGRKMILNEVQSDLHPLEILYDVKKLVQIANQPLTAASEKIVQAVALYDHYIDVQRGTFVEAEQWGQHAVQSVVWNMYGCTQLAQVEENIVTAFTEVGSNDNCRLVVTLNRAYNRARQGKYEGAIATLLEPDVWRGLSMTNYGLWASEIWHILSLRASRRGQERQFNDFLKPKRPNGPHMPREYWFGPKTPLWSIIRDPLYEMMEMRRIDQGHACVDQLLTALWHAEFQCRYGLYRTAIVMLADIGLEFGMTKWCRRIVDEIMPQVINGGDLEQRGLACFTLARCIIAAGKSTPESLRECLLYLELAEKDYTAISLFRSLQDVQYLQSVVYHNLDMIKERDAAAVRHAETEKQRKKANIVIVEDWIEEVWALVAEVGAALAAR